MTDSRGSLRTRVLAALALAVVAPTVLVGLLAIRRARADLEREVVRGNLALIRALGASLDQTLQNARRALDLAAAWWADGRTAETRDDEAARAATGRLLSRLRREVPLFSSLSIVSVDGALLYGDPVTAEQGVGAHSFGGYIGDVEFEAGSPQVRVVAQARSRTGELAGVFIAQLDLRFISDALAQSRLGEGARLIVVDGRGVPVARSDGALLDAGKSMRGESLAVDRALASTTEGDLEAGGMVAVYRNLSSYQSLRGVRWSLILEQPERFAYALARRTTRDTIIAGLVILTLALMGGVALANRIVRPLHDLAARADAIAGAGDPARAPPAPLDAPGEIGLLAHRFEEMANRIGERERLQAALARGDRLAAVGTMAAGVAHEINNPLTTVLGYAKLLLEDKPGDHADRAGLELIADEAARMKGIVRNLLDYSRTDRAESSPEPADVDELLHRTAALLGPSIRGSHVDVALELAGDLPAARADVYALQQVFVNLVYNAAQAMPDGGTVTVRSSLRPGGVAIAVDIVDQGPGISAEVRERIFEPFYTTKEAGKGTGLGLAVCKHLVARFDGSIEVADGEGGRGARFRVIIPVG